MTRRSVIAGVAACVATSAQAMDTIQLQPSVQSATLVLVWVCQVLIIGFPPMSWLKLHEQDVRSTRLWVGGLVCTTLSAVVLGLAHRANVITGATMVVGSFLILEAMRQEAGKPTFSRRWVAPSLVALAVAYLAIQGMDLYLSWGVLLTSFVLAVLEVALVYEVYRVGWPMRSRGLVMVAAGVLPVFFVNVVRVYQGLIDGQAQPLFATPALTNAVTLSFTIFSILVTVGFLSYKLEKTHHRHLRELEDANRRLSLAATLDNLTGLWNRRYFDEMVVAEMAKADRHHLPLSLVIFDVDHFKQINDTHGHQAGDRVLVELSQLARDAMRAGDILVRWGGEEFLLLLPNTGLAGAAVVADKLRTSFASRAIPGVGVVTASFGVVAYVEGQTVDGWIRRVDRALYAAKRSGRNRVQAAA